MEEPRSQPKHDDQIRCNQLKVEEDNIFVVGVTAKRESA